MENYITFLGTGTSQGVPMIGCSCDVCKSPSEKDSRLRSSVCVEYNGFKIIIDCGPDFRQQMLRENISDIDAVLLTHQHMDHIGGLDDIRAFNYFRQSSFPIYAEESVQQGVQRVFFYAFEKFKYPGVPDYELHTIGPEKFFIRKMIEGKEHCIGITPIRVMHYKLPILGFRFGKLAYITDGSAIPEEEYIKLEGLETLIINTVRHEKHISHFSLPEAVEIIKRVGAKRNYLTHLSHQIGRHEELSKELESICKGEKFTIEPAYDGLKLRF